MSLPVSSWPLLPPGAANKRSAAPDDGSDDEPTVQQQQQENDDLMSQEEEEEEEEDADKYADKQSKTKPRAKSKKTKRTDGRSDGTTRHQENPKAVNNKRPRKTQTQTPQRQRQRPPPPPAPPAVLVQLLQSNPAVLEYFQSLQANLQADVQIWKDRATSLEKDKKQLQRQVRTWQNEHNNGGSVARNNKKESDGRAHNTKKKSAPPRAKKSLDDDGDGDDDDDDSSPFAPARQAVTATATAAAGLHQEGVPIEDSMFDFDDDDDDSDNDHDDDGGGESGESGAGGESDTLGKPKALSTTKPKESRDDTSRKKHAGWFEFQNDDDDDDDSCLDDDKDDDDDLLQTEEELDKEKEQVRRLLMEAYSILERLGVSLVDIINVVAVAAVDENNVDDTAAGNNMDAATQAPPESQFTALRPDTITDHANVATNTVDMDVDDNDEAAQKQQETVATSIIQQHPPPPPRVVVTISPRTNEQVAADLLFAIKSLSRIQMLDSELMQSYPPFETTGLVPACNCYHPNENQSTNASSSSWTNSFHDSEQTHEQQPQDRPPHPLKQGKLLAFRALLILDTYCSANMTDDEWDSYFFVTNKDDKTDRNKMEEMRIGLRGRKQWVQHLVDSLHGEIVHFWAMQDRSVRLTTTALHFDAHDNNNRCMDDDMKNNEENAPLHVEDYEEEENTHGNGGDDAGVSLSLDKKNQNQPKAKASILGGGKSQARLSSLLERVCLCQLVVGFYLSHNDPQEVAVLVRDYLLSTAPCILSSNDIGHDNAEDYPKLPPVQSLVLLEAMLLPDAQMLWWLPTSDQDNDNDKLPSILDLVASLVVGDFNDGNNEAANSYDGTPVSTAIASFNSASATGVSLCIHATAFVWKQRLASSDDRIHDLSRVELAAYKRLIASKQGTRLGLNECVWSASRLQQELAGYFQVFSADKGTIEKITTRPQGNFGQQLCLILENSLQRSLPLSCFHRNDLDVVALHPVLFSWSIALRQLCIRHIDHYRAKSGPSNVTSTNNNELVGSCREIYDQLYSETLKEESDQLLLLLSATLQCCALLADGDTAFRCSWRLMTLLNLNQSTGDPVDRQAIFDLFRIVGHMPLIRVINLERRKDRMRSFRFQCIAHEVLVVRAVAGLNEPPTRATPDNDSDVIPDDGYYFGLHAIDGTGRMAEAHERLVKAVGFPKLDSLVGTHWCPNDLKAFDRDAPGDERLVRMSCSERACALSHIASWKGVLRSLVLPPMDMSSTALLERRHHDTNKKLLAYPDRLRRVFRISGFASGKAMHAQNHGMHPVPVCVILEDDAILVDRFVDRLQALLSELPRDFHFCSLGYSRPKAAPIVPYTRNQRNQTGPCILGIPTNLFYLTGYILSQAGAEYLLSNLPVVGPVDSWIGLKMTSNWDNVHGHVLGVGSHANVSSAATSATTSATASVPIAHKDLCQILHFRAFCAMHPLCSQRMMMGSTGAAAVATTSRSWRQRDTDVEYSG